MVKLIKSFYLEPVVRLLNKAVYVSEKVITEGLFGKLFKCNSGSNFHQSISRDLVTTTSLLQSRKSSSLLNITSDLFVLCNNPFYRTIYKMSNATVIDQAATAAPDSSNLEKTVTEEDLPTDSERKFDDLSQTSMSKRALKRQARAQKYKELKKKRKAEVAVLDGKDGAGYSIDDFNESSYYFENGLRKVYPYHYVFATHAKGRWVGRTLKDVLVNEFGFNHPSEVDNAFEREKIRVNNNLVTSDYVVHNCDYISHEIHRHENPVTDASIEVIEDNDDVIVINKPASIPCHPCGRYRYNSLVFILGKEMGYSNLRNIYRLDRMTSGVLILGKTAQSTKLLEDQVLTRQVQKEYVCRVVGEFPSDTITVDQPLQALSNKLRLQVISPKGKLSQTTFKRLSYNGRSSVVKCIPHTGRTHQIRVHLQYLGHPILNDVFYNSDAWGPTGGKGGVYEVSHDITCSRIYHLHQATQWDGGDNPLYHDKVQQESNETEMQHAKEGVPLVAKSLASSSSNANISKTDNVSNCSTNDSPLSLTAETDKEKIDRPTVDETLDGLSDQPPSSSDFDSANNAENVHSSSSRPKFEASKWIVDTSCETCRRKCVDTQQKDLVMFLHAVKYKGPGWEYKSGWPVWAQEDWNREDEFTVKSSL